LDVRRQLHVHPFARASTALLPPKANEWLSTCCGGCAARVPGSTSANAGNAASPCPSHQWVGSCWRGLSASTIQHSAASIAPDAPRVCPVSGLVELAGTVVPST